MVEIGGNIFENYTREQVHSNSLRKEFEREVLSYSNFLGYKDPIQTVPDLKVPDS